FNGFLRRRFCSRQIFLWCASTIHGEQCASISDACVSEGVVWIFVGRLLKVIERFLEIRGGPPVPEIAALKVEFMRLQVLRRLDRDGALFRTGELRLQLFGDRLGNITFDHENISELAVEGVRPKTRLCFSLYQLHINAHIVCGACTLPCRTFATPS